MQKTFSFYRVRITKSLQQSTNRFNFINNDPVVKKNSIFTNKIMNR